MREKEILKKTKKDYNEISEHFSKTRQKPWEDFEFIFQDIPEGSKVLDLGCGNGRFYEFLKGKRIEYVGIDKSEELIKIAKDKYPKADFRVGDGLDITFNDEFDFIISIAVLHHMPTKKTRLKFLREAKTALKPEGKLRVSVWQLPNENIYLKNLKDKLFGKIGWRDGWIPWKDSSGEVVTKRFYHFFKKKELRKLAEKAGFKVEKVFRKGEGKATNLFLFAKNDQESRSGKN